MENNQPQNFKRDELASIKLRRLFEQRGFRRVRVGKFEEYGLYIENKNFLQSDQIITFMDMDGRLLAFKPDMTLSVVKNIPAEPLTSFQKLYYVDEVYRASREHREYRALHQIGVEMVGPMDRFADLEVVDLALSSLEVIGSGEDNYVLDISHLGFVSGLLEYLGLPPQVEDQILVAIHSKSHHNVGPILEQAGAGEDARNRIIALSALHGGIKRLLEQARELVANETMEAAYTELAGVARALTSNGFGDHLNLDFSVVNDLDYYNGLIFKGYVEGLPQAVLNGGRYDNLMRRMGKQSGAVGFGIALDELKIHSRAGRRNDFDLLIRYAPDSDWAQLLACVHRLTAQGTSVRLEPMSANPADLDFRCGKVVCFTGCELAEEGEWSL